jgi:hypothetical protein
VQCLLGGYVMDDVSIGLSCRGGEAGGVTGRSPGEQTGMCLLGIAAGVPRDEVLRERCVAVVEVRLGMDGALATAAAMLARCYVDDAVEGTRRGVGVWRGKRRARRLCGSILPGPDGSVGEERVVTMRGEGGYHDKLG